MSIHLRPLYVEQVSHVGRLPVQHATAWSSSLYTYTDQGVISRTENAIQASQIQTDINRHLLDRYTRLHHNVS